MGVTFCRDFQRGMCNRDFCRYEHATREEEQEYLRTGVLRKGGVPPGT